ncbi:hypothetical protein N7478_000747 [Penicillium angulare]|uniref:uncharacterized protein n=1 Tax=Penicillium angulare TaxID=116970 RepID=UPI002540D9B0|nr:uncharacterized protein N7478_000665 [Penicillium angulare]XP_056784842.1 uncharacterized protein N7478_000747 [Penicillium angulare]KAJ5291414.1 hypothetical protein N7478_000665 [Penicillium angulare]KAJ5291496.1 hypothetical protein N7478_000747 [Penicillium angulare]
MSTRTDQDAFIRLSSSRTRFKQGPDPNSEKFFRTLLEVQEEFSKLEFQVAKMIKELEEIHGYTSGLYKEYTRVAFELDRAKNSHSP